MLWSSSRPRQRLGLPLALAIATGTAVWFFSAASASDGEQHLSIFSTVASYSLPLSERNGQDYVGLLELLDPLGKVTAKNEGKRWKIRYNEGDSEFTAGNKRVRVGRSGFDLPGNFLLENGRGLVPVSSLPQLLAHILGGPVTFHENSRRLFIGNVGVHFTAQVSKVTNPSLVIHFTAPVNPTIATESGKLRMRFTREPLVGPGSPVLTFDSKIISSANYAENNGAAEITVTGSAPLFAAFSEDRKTITITAAQQAVGPAQSIPAAGIPNPPGAAAGPPPGVASSPGSAPSGTTVPGQRKYFAVVDASHGGDERGAALSDQLAEKDVTLAFARQLKQQLENRGISTLLLRDGDINLTFDQRASQTNSVHPAIYLCVHASQGSGLRLYTALIPAGGESHGPFLAWDTAQAPFLSASQATAASVAVELRNQEISVRTMAAPLRPLNNIGTAAIALEFAPAGGKLSDLYSSDYQQLIAGTVAAGIVDARARLEAGQ